MEKDNEMDFEMDGPIIKEPKIGDWIVLIIFGVIVVYFVLN